MMTTWKAAFALIFTTLLLSSPAQAKFYSNDPVSAQQHLNQGNIQGFNRYAYANNNPYKYVDPDGRTGKIANLVVKLVKNKGNPKSAGKEFVEDVVDSFSTLADPSSSGLEKAEAVFNLISPVGTNDIPGVKKGSVGGKGAGKAFPTSVKDQARQESNNKCVFCGTKTTNTPGPTRSEIDHSIPKSRDGNNTIDNAQNTCRTCNRQKGALTSEEFIEKKSE